MHLPFSLPDSDVPDSLDRFVSRVLRREVIDALATQGQDADATHRLVLYGSGSVQMHRPLPGYPIRRMARDIDIGIVASPEHRRHDPDPEIRQELGRKIIAAIEAAGATVVEGSAKGIPGYDGLKFTKTYDVEAIAARVHGRMEEADVQYRLKREHDLAATLEVEEVIMRSPLLPPQPLGDNGFLITDIRETIGEKLARMVSAEPVVRDMIDLYNVFNTPSPIIDLEQNRELLRTLAVVNIARKGMTVNETYITGCEAAIEEVFERLFARSEAQMAHLAEEVKEERMARAVSMSEKVAKSVAELYREIFPPEVERGSEFTPQVRTRLNFSDAEIRFMMNLRGTDKPKGTPHYFREQTTPSIQAHAIVSPELASHYPDLVEQIKHKHELQNIVDRMMSRGL